MDEHEKDSPVIWVVMVITVIIAFIIGQSLGVRSKSILYILVALELIIYKGVKWVLNQLNK